MRRYLLDLVQREGEIISFVLVVNEPVNYFVEQCHEPLKPFRKAQVHHIEPKDFSKYYVNDVSLVQLVERKLEELANESVLNAA